MTEERVEQLRAECVRLELRGAEILRKYTARELLGIYNGTGPDCWPEKAREVASALTRRFACVVLWHDTAFHESDGTRAAFDAVCAAWRYNTWKVLRAAYPLWTWRSIDPRYRAERLYYLAVKEACDYAIGSEAAFSSYCAAYQNRLRTAG